MVKSVVDELGVTKYELEPPSMVNMQYLIVRAVYHIEFYYQNVYNPSMRNHMTDIDFMYHINGI